MNQQQIISLVPFASLCVALIAVFFGPLVTLLIAKRQWRLMRASVATQVLAPVRSKWISELRDLLAQTRSRAHFYYVAESDGEADWKAERKEFHLEMTKLYHQIALMLDPDIPEEKELIELVGAITLGITEKTTDLKFGEIMARMEQLARSVVRAKWQDVAVEMKAERI
ncbi:MAG: hypothetical protein V4727_13775 [Verrucomicrobiota bacterium]